MCMLLFHTTSEIDSKRTLSWLCSFGSSRKNKVKTKSFWNLFLKLYGKETYAGHSTSIRGTKQTVLQLRKEGIRIAVTTGRMCRASTVRHELGNIGIDQCVELTITKATVLRFKNPHHATSRSAELREVLEASKGWSP